MKTLWKMMFSEYENCSLFLKSCKKIKPKIQWAWSRRKPTGRSGDPGQIISFLRTMILALRGPGFSSHQDL